MIREQIKDYVLISALSGSVTHAEDMWLIDSGASKHMIGQKNILSCVSEKKFSQKEGIDYEESFAPVARYTSIRTIIALTAKMKWKLQ
jgi:hypothetical protein